jgi:hypothetical protein
VFIYGFPWRWYVKKMAKIPDAMQVLKDQRPYFDYRKAVIKDPKYVAWIDLMGSGSVLSISDVMASIFIGKLHSCVLSSKEKALFGGNIYPFVDGVYVTSSDRSDIQRFVKCVFRLMALNFIFETAHEHRFLLRGSISFGRVIEAENIRECADVFEKSGDYASGILFGTPLARAYASERHAAPFGIWIDDNARHFAPNGEKTIRTTFWDWWTYPSGIKELDEYCDQIEHILSEELHQYFGWCRRNYLRTLYPLDAIARHEMTASQYFPSWPK